VLVRLELAKVWNCTVWQVDEAGEDEIGRQLAVWESQARYTPKPDER
jgi:hypothetical protein